MSCAGRTSERTRSDLYIQQQAVAEDRRTKGDAEDGGTRATATSPTTDNQTGESRQRQEIMRSARLTPTALLPPSLARRSSRSFSRSSLRATREHSKMTCSSASNKQH